MPVWIDQLLAGGLLAAPPVGTLDLIFLAVVVVGIEVGLAQGLIRQLVGVLILYLAIVLAAQYHELAADAIRGVLPGVNWVLASTYGLVATFLLANGGLHWLGYQVYPGLRLPQVVSLDRLGGGAAGLVWGVLVAGLAMTILSYVLALPWGVQEHVRRDMGLQLAHSQLAPPLQRTLALFFETLRPWMPGGLPASFVLTR